MNPNNQIVEDIRAAHRQRRFAMKIQQKLDRALESFIRINATDWSPDLDEKQREKINAKVKQIIKDTRAGTTDAFADVIATSDKARQPADDLRKVSEATMTNLAADLAVAPWCTQVRGAGMLGLATIVAETGDLSKYANPAKIWKRLGFAPYGEPGKELAGSTWKRESWRPRPLTKEEWIANPFSGERYALIHQVAVWLRNAQWIGKAKTEDGVGKPNGIYGQVYADRRARTAITHPDWSDGHADKDAIRIMMKQFLRDLWVEWHRAAGLQRPASERMESRRNLPGDSSGGHDDVETQRIAAARRPARNALKPSSTVSGGQSGGHRTAETLSARAARRPARIRVKSMQLLPGNSSDGHDEVKIQLSHAARRPAKRPTKLLMPGHSGGHRANENQKIAAAKRPASARLKSSKTVPGARIR